MSNINQTKDRGGGWRHTIVRFLYCTGSGTKLFKGILFKLKMCILNPSATTKK